MGGAGIEKMKRKFKSFKEHLTTMKESDAKLLFQEWDTDTDGKVSKQEFKKCIEFRMEEVAYKASAIVVDSSF